MCSCASCQSQVPRPTPNVSLSLSNPQPSLSLSSTSVLLSLHVKRLVSILCVHLCGPPPFESYDLKPSSNVLTLRAFTCERQDS